MSYYFDDQVPCLIYLNVALPSEVRLCNHIVLNDTIEFRGNIVH